MDVNKTCIKCGSLQHYPCGDCRPCAIKRAAALRAKRPQKQESSEKRRARLKKERQLFPARVRARERAGRRKRLLPDPTRPEPKLCECCGGPPGKKSLALDHDHVTGRFRGWLCFQCNVGIGALGDHIRGLECAVRYLERHHLSVPYGN